MKPSGNRSLGRINGKATYDQGDRETANAKDEKATRNRRPLASTIRKTIEEPIDEPPNESSYLPLEQPKIEPEQWEPQDKMRLIIVVGMLILVAVSMVTGSSVTNQLIAVLSLVVGYLFGRGTKRKPGKKF